MATVLSIQNLTKKFGKRYAVNQLAFQVDEGQIFGMLGPNGSGKTTTLGMLMGVINPTSGSYSWFGEPPTHYTRRKIGAVLEHPIFYPYLSGQRNLELMALIKGAPFENIYKVLELVELSDRKNDKYQTYSLGMKQRLAIATALVNDPIVLILDEPTNGLDPMGIAQIRAIIAKIAAAGKTIILASHLLDEVQKICTHFAILRKGNMLHIGAINDVSENETIFEVGSTQPDLEMWLQKFEGTQSIIKEHGQFLVKIKNEFQSSDLSLFLSSHGIIVSHFAIRKKKLETQFLEILATADHETLAKN